MAELSGRHASYFITQYHPIVIQCQSKSSKQIHILANDGVAYINMEYNCYGSGNIIFFYVCTYLPRYGWPNESKLSLVGVYVASVACRDCKLL